MLNLAKYSWSTKQVENEELILAQLQKAGLEHSPAFLRVCIRRGLTTPEAIKEATDQKPQLYHDPHLMFDMDKAIERINQEKKMSIILVEQNARLALKLSHQAYALENGEIIREGKGAELLVDPFIQKAYLGI